MLAWHYRTGQKFFLIINSGFLRPTDIGVNPPEMPILWFSLNQYWENTANKGWHQDGITRTLSMQETYERAGGLIRFGIEVKRLYVGAELKRKARMNNRTWKALYDEGIAKFAKPSEWCGAIEPIPIDGLTVEVMSEKFVWERVPFPA
jgi:hypothetical protein